MDLMKYSRKNKIMKKLTTIHILAIITILEIVGDTLIALNSNNIDLGNYTSDLDSIVLWIGYGIFRGFRWLLKD